MPALVKKGSALEPAAMLGKEKVLLIAGRWSRPTFHSYDLRTKKFRTLGTAPKWTDCSACFELRSVATSETRIVWTVGVYRSEPWNAGKRHVELWTMPRSGGDMKLVTWLTGHDELPMDDELSIAGDDAVWRGGSHAYRVPLGGGPAQRLSVAERKAPEFPGLESLATQCGREWCVGMVPSRRYALTELAVLRKDGSDRRKVVAAYGKPLMNDRFGLFGGPYIGDVYDGDNPGPQPVLYDRCTDTTARIGGLLKEDPGYEMRTGGETAAAPDEPILYWTSPDRKSWTVLDLSRIPDSPCQGGSVSTE
ncbi:hypothetical protein SAMN05444920_12741 [Nonomuraea solani]|uniref:Uncharacterized protein n=1 Tax=Nonomuraea solani TaxID=1144553 RepID=A0A1H6EYQ1_9ACTN|nr:hypothetical protein SAMN05444920_12741 [Nonomuraea solani]